MYFSVNGETIQFFRCVILMSMDSYRYSATKFRDQLLTMGVLRIGTLHDFRRAEHKRGIADPEEGKKRVYHHITKLLISNSNDEANQKSVDFRSLSAFNAVKLSGCSNITFENVTLNQHFESPDFFILCSSSNCSEKTMNEFEGADSCLRINNIEDFYWSLTNTLNLFTPVVFEGIHQVKYQSKAETWNGVDWGTHPALIKPLTYQRQHEIRAIWRPRYGQPIEPLITGNSNLGSFCEAVRVR